MIPLYPKSWQRAAVLVTIAMILAVGLCAWPYTVDDAFIVARYASRLAQGKGYTFNPGAPTDGVTGPLWLLPGWFGALLGVDPVYAAKGAGLACSAIAGGALVARLSRRSRGTWYAAAAAVLMACQPTLGGWGAAGLETGAATLALTVAALALTARPRAQLWRFGAALGLLPWLRPELLGAASVLLLAAVARLGWRQCSPALALSALGLGSIVAFRGAMFGSVLPLAYHAKQGALGHGVEYAVQGACIVVGLFALPLVWRGARAGRADDRLFGWVLLAHVLAVALAGGDWMPGFRLFAPVLPLAVALIAVGAMRPTPARGGVRPWGLGLLGLAAAFLALDLATRMPEWRTAGESRERAGRALADTLRSEARRVAMVDIGFLAYASGVEVVDLGGITDPEIGRFRGGHLDKVVPGAWLAAREPDALVLHSAAPPLVAADGRLQSFVGYPVEHRVAAGAWVRQHFRVAARFAYAPHYHYVLLLPARGD